MLCGRSPCEEKEDRIDGYCSVYCRDIHELQLEIERLKKDAAPFQAQIDQRKTYRVAGEEDGQI